VLGLSYKLSYLSYLPCQTPHLLHFTKQSELVTLQPVSRTVSFSHSRYFRTVLDSVLVFPAGASGASAANLPKGFVSIEIRHKSRVFMHYEESISYVGE
jgi:hypothetical protein